MIQRIQTIYLLLITGLTASMMFLPVAEIGITYKLSVECGLAALLSLVAIFLFKKRKTQITFCYVILGLLVLSYLKIFFDIWMPNSDTISFSIFKVPVVFPFFAIVLDLLAILAIQKDEKLVKSLDRLR